MSEDLIINALEEVQDRASFLEFVRLLKHDRRQALRQELAAPVLHSLGGANGWANVTIEGYLEAAIACSEDRGDDVSLQEPTWRMFAEFLYGGKIYE